MAPRKRRRSLRLCPQPTRCGLVRRDAIEVTPPGTGRKPLKRRLPQPCPSLAARVDQSFNPLTVHTPGVVSTAEGGNVHVPDDGRDIATGGPERLTLPDSANEEDPRAWEPAGRKQMRNERAPKLNALAAEPHGSSGRFERAGHFFRLSLDRAGPFLNWRTYGHFKICDFYRR
jgi:hypothetical protein